MPVWYKQEKFQNCISSECLFQEPYRWKKFPRVCLPSFVPIISHHATQHQGTQNKHLYLQAAGIPFFACPFFIRFSGTQPLKPNVLSLLILNCKIFAMFADSLQVLHVNIPFFTLL